MLIFGINPSNLLILYYAEERFFLLSSKELPILLTNGTMILFVMSFIWRAFLDGCVGAGGGVVWTCWLDPACSPCCPCCPVAPAAPAAPAAPTAPAAPAAPAGGLLSSLMSVMSAIPIADMDISEKWLIVYIKNRSYSELSYLRNLLIFCVRRNVDSVILCSCRSPAR